MRTRVIGAALLGAAILSLGSGCGSKSDGATAAGPAPGQGTTAPAGTAAKSTGLSCPSGTTVGGQVDMTFTNADPELARNKNDSVVCRYQGTKNDTNKAESVMVTIYDNLNSGYMDNFRQQDAEWHPVTQGGVGDDAFSFQTQAISTTLNNLVVRKGTRIVVVSGNATMAQLVSLANVLLGA